MELELHSLDPKNGLDVRGKLVPASVDGHEMAGTGYLFVRNHGAPCTITLQQWQFIDGRPTGQREAATVTVPKRKSRKEPTDYIYGPIAPGHIRYGRSYKGLEVCSFRFEPSTLADAIDAEFAPKVDKG
jgi:hypothetical protein